MKLWLKLTIILTIIINLIIQIGVFALKPGIETFSENILEDRLKSIAASISASIDGNEFSMINIFDSQSAQSRFYKHTLNTIEIARANLTLDNDKFTISIIDKNSLTFGVLITEDQKGSNSLQELDETGKSAALEVFNKKRSTTTKPNKNRYGNWLSGFAPITDYNNDVVGVVKVDQKYEAIQAKVNEVDNQIFAGRIALIPLTILIILILSNFLFISYNASK